MNDNHKASSNKKKIKKKPLTEEDKLNNQALSSQPVVNENVISLLKRFKMIAIATGIDVRDLVFALIWLQEFTI